MHIYLNIMYFKRTRHKYCYKHNYLQVCNKPYHLQHFLQLKFSNNYAQYAPCKRKLRMILHNWHGIKFIYLFFYTKQTTENIQKNIAALCSGCSTFDVGLNTEETAVEAVNNTCSNPVDCSTTKYTQSNQCGGATADDVIVTAVTTDQPSSMCDDIESVAAPPKLKSPKPVGFAAKKKNRKIA